MSAPQPSTSPLAALPDGRKQPALAARPDGRKQRWQEHKAARRQELVDGTLSAIATLGADAGMDQIAAEIGVSKTVLYRYFTDKQDLTNAATTRFVETVLAPRILASITEDLDDYPLIRHAVTGYVETIAANTEVYLYLAVQSSGGNEAIADTERMLAEAVATVILDRAHDLGFDPGGTALWAYTLVGGIQLATHWWISNHTMSATELIDYLVMFVWSALQGLYQYRGSRDTFNAAEHSLADAVPATGRG